MNEYIRKAAYSIFLRRFYFYYFLLYLTLEKYPEIGILLPAMGYGEQQIKDLEETINSIECDAVVIGTPIDLRRIVKINKPAAQVKYDLQEIGHQTLKEVLKDF